MNWGLPKSTIILDDIFDPDKGWYFPNAQVPLKRKISFNGEPFYSVTIDKLRLSVIEQTPWKDEAARTTYPTRVIVIATFLGVTLKDPAALLRASRITGGLPSFGLDEDGHITLQASFPVGLGFPSDLARRQALVCIGLVAENVKANLHAWNKASDPEADGDIVGNVASVADIFLRALTAEP
jgi:hypothetical protein